ncbi:hypothetical protein BC829DRAFT_290125 [Chytridium lagenaria]|nr:hypothetical protein BC829DRAFT_290125 [Chytridium lagenaria]
MRARRKKKWRLKKREEKRCNPPSETQASALTSNASSQIHQHKAIDTSLAVAAPLTSQPVQSTELIHSAAPLKPTPEAIASKPTIKVRETHPNTQKLVSCRIEIFRKALKHRVRDLEHILNGLRTLKGEPRIQNPPKKKTLCISPRRRRRRRRKRRGERQRRKLRRLIWGYKKQYRKRWRR